MILDNNTSIHEFDDSPFVITPNPSIGNFSIQFKNHDAKPNYIKIYDQLGKEIFHYNITQEIDKINVDLNLNSGVYFIVSGKKEFKKLIVTK